VLAPHTLGSFISLLLSFSKLSQRPLVSLGSKGGIAGNTYRNPLINRNPVISSSALSGRVFPLPANAIPR